MQRFSLTDKGITIGYFTENKWIDAERVVLAVSGDFLSPSELFICNAKSGEIIGPVRCVADWGDYSVRGEKLYYTAGDRLCIRDICSEETDEIIFDGIKPQSPHTTIDGRYVSVFAETILQDGSKRKTTNMYVCDINSLTARLVFSKRFAEPFYFADHVMICPCDSNRIIFAHEGTTEYISNRIWLYDAKTDSARNLVKQNLNADGNLGDCIGHEVWSDDGKYIYYVKYACSPEPQRGLYRADSLTGELEFLFGAYKYWHVAVSPDGKKLVSDTQKGGDISEVVLCDLETGSETLLYEAKTTWRHPCHPHPQFSPDSKRVGFTTLGDSGNLETVIIEIE